jgi:hypothetical protein
MCSFEGVGSFIVPSAIVAERSTRDIEQNGEPVTYKYGRGIRSMADQDAMLVASVWHEQGRRRAADWSLLGRAWSQRPKVLKVGNAKGTVDPWPYAAKSHYFHRQVSSAFTVQSPALRSTAQSCKL